MLCYWFVFYLLCFWFFYSFESLTRVIDIRHPFSQGPFPGSRSPRRKPGVISRPAVPIKIPPRGRATPSKQKTKGSFCSFKHNRKNLASSKMKDYHTEEEKKESLLKAIKCKLPSLLPVKGLTQHLNLPTGLAGASPRIQTSSLFPCLIKHQPSLEPLISIIPSEVVAALLWLEGVSWVCPSRYPKHWDPNDFQHRHLHIHSRALMSDPSWTPLPGDSWGRNNTVSQAFL